MIEQSEYIKVESLKSLCPQVFDGVHEPAEGIVFCDPEKITELFQFRKNKYTVVSGASDATLCLQENNPVNKDILFYVQTLVQISNMVDDYISVQLPPRCDVMKCRYNHKYSIKYHPWTICTFNDLPDNITRWYLPNCCVQHERITCIPFGVGKDCNVEFKYNKPKTKWLYVNFDCFSHAARHPLKEYWREQAKHNHWITFRDKPLPYNEYVEELAEHRFVLAPEGNGVDSYRVWEALYSGVIPINSNSQWNFAVTEDLPIFTVPSLKDIDLEYLQRICDIHYIFENFLNLKRTTLSYWREQIGL